jgi:hypothetical protein
MRSALQKVERRQAEQRAERLRADRLLPTPDFLGLSWAEHEGQPVVEGDLLLDDGYGPPQAFAVRIVFPAAYPLEEPSVYDVQGQFLHIADRHFYHDGRCCFWHPLESGWDSSDPQGLLRIVAEIAAFFRRQLICDAMGEYPGPQRAHGDDGTYEALAARLGGAPRVALFQEALLFQGECGCNAPCPCGSRRKYKKCHLSVLQSIRARMSQDALRQVFGIFRTLPNRATRRAAQWPRPAPKVPYYQRRSRSLAHPAPLPTVLEH